MSIKGADWCHEVVNEPEPDSDEEDEEEEDDKEKDEWKWTNTWDVTVEGITSFIKVLKSHERKTNLYLNKNMVAYLNSLANAIDTSSSREPTMRTNY